MPIYTGSSADGSDMREVKGFFVSPDGEQWSNMPYTLEQRAYDKVYDHMVRTGRTLREEYDLILAKKSTLSRYCRDFIANQFETNK